MAGSDALMGRTVARHGIIEKLCSGDTGVVYKAEDTRLDRLVALKFMPETLAPRTPSSGAIAGYSIL